MCSNTPDTGSNTWQQVKGAGDTPGYLQGHSMVEYQDILYIFGGELSLCNDEETPLWMFHIKVELFLTLIRIVREDYRIIRGRNILTREELLLPGLGEVTLQWCFKTPCISMVVIKI